MHPSWWAARAKVGEPGVPTPWVESVMRRLAWPWARLMHRPSLTGFEHLPTEGPFLMVANHSGGLSISEVFSFVGLWLERFGRSRPLAGLAHPFAFHFWPVAPVMRGLGSIPSTYEAAQKTLAAGVPVIVFPGGDYEAGRPIWKANRVDFGGRQGFLRIARAARVPIVPMGIAGSHYSAPIVWQSRRILPWFLVLPWLYGIKRFPLTLLGLCGAIAIVLSTAGLGWPWRLLFAWLFLVSPLPLVPWWPSTIRMRIGAPIPPDELFGSESDDDALPSAYQRVVGAIQRLVDG